MSHDNVIHCLDSRCFTVRAVNRSPSNRLIQMKEWNCDLKQTHLLCRYNYSWSIFVEYQGKIFIFVVMAASARMSLGQVITAIVSKVLSNNKFVKACILKRLPIHLKNGCSTDFREAAWHTADCVSPKATHPTYVESSKAQHWPHWNSFILIFTLTNLFPTPHNGHQARRLLCFTLHKIRPETHNL